ncbi:uncharacterized protein LOC144139363 [Haemaphysalis longicornis]
MKTPQSPVPNVPDGDDNETLPSGRLSSKPPIAASACLDALSGQISGKPRWSSLQRSLSEIRCSSSVSASQEVLQPRNGEAPPKPSAQAPWIEPASVSTLSAAAPVESDDGHPDSGARPIGSRASSRSASSAQASKPSTAGSAFSRMAFAASEGSEVARCSAHCQDFANTSSSYFVEARSGRMRGLHSPPLFRAVLCRTSPSATASLYRNLLHPPLLHKPCARNSGPQGAGFLRQSGVPNNSPWDPAAEFGLCPLVCGVDVLGGGLLLRLSPIGHGHWGHNGLRSMRAPRSVPFNAVMCKLAGRDVDAGVKPSVRDYVHGSHAAP